MVGFVPVFDKHLVEVGLFFSVALGDNKQKKGCWWVLMKWLINPVGTKCNLLCQYCCQDHVYEVEKFSPRIKMDMLKDLFEGIGDCCGDKVFLHWHGGEPLLAGRDFFQRAVHMQLNAFSCNTEIYNAMSTNGLLLDRQWLSWFIDNRIELVISIDGSDYYQNSYRFQSEEDFERVVQRLHLIRQAGGQLDVSLVVHDRNWDRAADICSFMSKVGISQLRLLPCLCGDDKQVSPLTVDIERFGRFCCDLFDAWVKLKSPFRVTLFSIIFRALATGFLPVCYFSGHCSSVHVENDGSVYSSCVITRPDTFLGNLSSSSVKDIIDKFNMFSGNLAAKPGDARDVLLKDEPNPVGCVDSIVCPYFNHELSQYMYMDACRMLAYHVFVSSGWAIDEFGISVNQ